MNNVILYQGISEIKTSLNIELPNTR